MILSVQGLRKSYKGKPALRGIDLAVPQGSICGFLGRNGAGKTTTLKLLLGLIRPDAGSIRLFGEPVDSEAAGVAARRRIGFVSEGKDLYPFMTVGQMIRFTRPFFPTWRADLEQKYLELFELPLNKLVVRLSKGMRTKLMLLLALAHTPELLLLDEPTDGLDPAVTEDVLECLAGIAAEGATIFMASHQLPEVEQICDRVCLLEDGRVVLDGQLDDLKSDYRRVHLVFENDAPTAIESLAGCDHAQRRGRTAALLAHDDVDSLIERARAFQPVSVEVQPVTLKELFLDLAGRK